MAEAADDGCPVKPTVPVGEARPAFSPAPGTPTDLVDSKNECIFGEPVPTGQRDQLRPFNRLDFKTRECVAKDDK